MNLQKTARHLLGALLLVLLAWQALLSLGGYSEALFPSPLATLQGLHELIADGVLLKDIGASLYRFAVGYFSSVLLAMLLGLVLGWYRGVWAYLNPIAQVLRPISPMASLVIIFIAAFFPVLLATVAAVHDIAPVYLKVAQNFGIRQPALLAKIVFPAVFPRIATGLHLALGTAWVFLVAGEMVGAQSGLGFLIIDARNNLRADLLMAAIITIGVLGLLLDGGVTLVERAVSRRFGSRVA